MPAGLVKITVPNHLLSLAKQIQTLQRESDAMRAVLRGGGHNLRMILKKLQLFFVLLLSALFHPTLTVDLFRAD